MEVIHDEVRFETATCVRNHAGLMSAARGKTGFGTQDRMNILTMSIFNQYLPSSALFDEAQKLAITLVCAKVKDR
jgi:hypothetical protein